MKAALDVLKDLVTERNIEAETKLKTIVARCDEEARKRDRWIKNRQEQKDGIDEVRKAAIKAYETSTLLDEDEALTARLNALTVDTYQRADRFRE